MNINDYLSEHPYIDYSTDNIKKCMETLYAGNETDIEKAKTTYYSVRDEIPHSFDCNAVTITAKASDVLLHKTGICHAKANLLAALLRPQGIPTGFCFQRLTLMDDDRLGYCVHCYNAIYLDNRWIKVDARGNTNGKNAAFSMEEPILAFSPRRQYDEYFWGGIYAEPHAKTMTMLESSMCLQDVLNNIPDNIDDILFVK